MIFIRDGTRARKLMLLLACVGEYPMQSVCLLGNDRVWKRRIRESAGLLPAERSGTGSLSNAHGIRKR